MKAQVIQAFGGPEVFTTVELPKPEVKPGHLLIKVAATSVNPADYKIRLYGPPFAPDLPAILHADLAGTVEQVGEGVADFKPGDEVYGCAGGIRGSGGALADYILADARLVAHKPRSLTMPQAAALPLVTITAWEALIDRAKIQPGQKVLIHGATGGVSHVAIQLAKWAGATVFATASSEEKMAIARQLGADVAINYRKQAVKDYVAQYTQGRGFEVVFDTLGGEVLEQAFEAAAPYGTVVTIMANGNHNLDSTVAKSLTVQVVFMLIPLIFGIGRERHGQILKEVARLVEEGKLKPLLDPHTFTFNEVAAAHRYAESGKQLGKVVLLNQSIS